MFGKRKFIFSLIFAPIIITVSAILNFLQFKIDDNFVRIAITIYLGYLTSNIFSKVSRKRKNISVNERESFIKGKRKFIFSLLLGFYCLVIISILAFLRIPIQYNFFRICLYTYLGYLFTNTINKYIKFLGDLKLPLSPLKKKREKIIND